MYLLRIILLILMISLFKGPSLYSDEVSTEAVQKMPLTGNVVKEGDKKVNSNLDDKIEDVEKIDINNADIKALKTLHGVGPVIAKRIIEYRKTHGGFSAIEEIKNVKGIGEKKFKEIKEMITVKESLKNKKGAEGKEE